MDLSIIIVTHNSEKYILNCLNSIGKAATDLNHEICVIDNNSTDQTIEYLKQFPTLFTLIENSENQGFAKAVNMGLRKSSGEFRLLINPDVAVQSDSLAPILDFMRKNPRVGICGCKLLNGDGSVQFSKGSFPTLSSTVLRMILPRRMRKYDLWGYGRTGECDWVTGAFALIRNRVNEEVGYLDEEYFMYYEDVDYCLQAKKAGWEIQYYPSVAAYHLRPHALSGRNFEMEGHIRKSRLYYFQKNQMRISHSILSFFTRNVEERFSQWSHSG